MKKIILILFSIFLTINLFADLDVSGYVVYQYNSAQSFTIPSGTIIPDNGYLIIGRDATQADFETYWGVAFASNVVYLNSGGTFPLINEDEYFTVHNASGTLIDTTSDSLIDYYTLQRDSTNGTTFRLLPDDSSNPGSGANGGNGVGLVINEYSDAGSYVYEFIELYYDAGGTSANLPPAIGSPAHSPEYVFAGDNVNVNVNISDDSGILADTLFYRVNSGVWNSVQNDSVSGIVYYYTLGQFNSNDIVDYYVKAVDDSSVSAVSDTNSFTVIDTSNGVIDISGYILYQHNTDLSYTFSDVRIPGNGYLLISRYSSKEDFETFWGVSLANNVIFINAQGNIPQLNGGELFALYNSDTIIIDSTMDTLIVGNTLQRDSTNVNTWTLSAETNATPGSGANGGYNLGLKINEYSDASTTGDYVYEFVEIYYDNDGSVINTPPYFSNKGQTPTNPQPSENVSVYIDITDDSGIATDSMYYRVDAGVWNVVYHDSLNTNTYYFSIPGQIDNAYVTYYFIAIDDSSAKSVSDTFNYTVRETSGAGYKILFDYTKDETAGNADWIIDLNYPIPLPADPTTETDWDGANSFWGFELDTFGYECQTLPPDSAITYGTGGIMDLANFNVFIVCEPQNQFTLSEKQAIFDFVRNGGGLFMVSDHNASDRNANGWDSPRIWNDLGASDSFGMHFDTTGESYNSVSDTGITFIGNDTIYDGIFGNATGGEFIFHLGTTMPASVKAIEVVPHPSSSSYSMLSCAYFGSGRVVGMSDSSPTDDGTGDPGDALYDGWTEGVSRILILNATYWLSGVATTMQNEINCSYNYDNDYFYINLYLSNSCKYHSIRIYKRNENQRTYKYISSYSSEKNMIIQDNISNDSGKIYYKITGITSSGEEIVLQIIKDNIIKNNSIKINENIIINGTIKLNNNNSIKYSIIDDAGRIVLNGIAKNKIDIKNIQTGIYFLKLESGDIYKIINIK